MHYLTKSAPFLKLFGLMAFMTGFVLAATLNLARAADRHAEYYYPVPESKEIYWSFAKPFADSSKRGRVGLTVGLNAQQRKRPYAPEYHIFAKGSDAQKMIIVATNSNKYNTLYRLRALLASLTADARVSELFRKLPNPEDANFLDLARMAGFTLVTITDGDKLAHQIELQ